MLDYLAVTTGVPVSVEERLLEGIMDFELFDFDVTAAVLLKRHASIQN